MPDSQRVLDFASATEVARSGNDLTVDQAGHLISEMLTGGASDEAVGGLLLALAEKGESVDELVGAARAMRKHMTTIPHHHPLLLDTCGTGGSGSGTFNISTAVAIVSAACGVPVAKHGNRRATSLTGSADVLEELGVPIESEADRVAERLDTRGLCFCFAVKLHPAMKNVAQVRRKLGVKTLFNLLGPLCNPAGATHQLLGASAPRAQEKIAAALRQLGTSRSFVVHAEDGQDEISLGCPTEVLDVRPSAVSRQTWTADSFGLAACDRQSLAAADPAASARIIRAVIAGEPGPCRDTVIAGTAAGLVLVGRAETPQQGATVAADAIDSGAAADKLRSLQRDL